MIKHTTKATTVGMIKASIVHFKLPVSFLMVHIVVEQGQWSRLNNMVFNAVRIVQPLFRKISLSEVRFSMSTKVFVLK